MTGSRAQTPPPHSAMPGRILWFSVDCTPAPRIFGSVLVRPGYSSRYIPWRPVPCSGCPAQNCRSPISRDSRFWVMLWPACRNGLHGNVAGRMRSIPSRSTSRSRGRQRSAAPVRPEVVQAWHLLERSQGRITVSTLASRVGISSRYLTTLFQREVGRSPKTVAMLMRFQRATSLLALSARRGRVDLAAIAAETGFSDQAHLTHEFVRFTGVPPRTWLAAEFRNIQDGGHSFGSECEHDYLDAQRVADP